MAKSVFKDIRTITPKSEGYCVALFGPVATYLHADLFTSADVESVREQVGHLVLNTGLPLVYITHDETIVSGTPQSVYEAAGTEMTGFTARGSAHGDGRYGVFKDLVRPGSGSGNGSIKQSLLG